MSSNNTLSIEGAVRRSRVGGGEYELAIVRALEDLNAVVVGERVIDAGLVAQQLSFGSVTTAKGVVLVTNKKIGLHINGVGATEQTCGSYFINLDTDITSIYIDHDINAPTEPVTVEWWLAT
jgi:hypothetical protein